MSIKALNNFTKAIFMKHPLTEMTNDRWLFDQLLRLESYGEITVSRHKDRALYDVLMFESANQGMGANIYAEVLTGYECRITM